MRPATLADVKRYYPDVGASFRAWVAELDGDVVGIIGVVLSRPYACLMSAFNEELRPYLRTMTIMKTVKKVQKICEDCKTMVVAYAEQNEETSPKLLQRLGFQYYGIVDGGDLYILGSK